MRKFASRVTDGNRRYSHCAELRNGILGRQWRNRSFSRPLCASAEIKSQDDFERAVISHDAAMVSVELHQLSRRNKQLLVRLRKLDLHFEGDELLAEAQCPCAQPVERLALL